MMEITLTCSNCSSGISFTPMCDITEVCCQICEHKEQVRLEEEHLNGVLKRCPSCERQDFYKQKDFNRKIGVILFIIAALGVLWLATTSFAPYAVLPFLILYIFDFILFRKLGLVVICYKCDAVFREVANIGKIRDFDHEMNDRIIYSGHDFQGR